MLRILLFLALFSCDSKKDFSYDPSQVAFIKTPSNTIDIEQEPDQLQTRFVELLNTQGLFAADDVEAEFLKREFSPVNFQGKKFPGDEGDCSSILFKNRSCRIAVDVFSSKQGRYVDELIVRYNNGIEKTSQRIVFNTVIGDEAKLSFSLIGHSGLDLGVFEGAEKRTYDFQLKNDGMLSANHLDLKLQGVQAGVMFNLLSNNCPTKLTGGQSCQGKIEVFSTIFGIGTGQFQASYMDHKQRPRTAPFFLELMSQDVRGDWAWVTKSPKGRLEHDFLKCPHTTDKLLNVRFSNKGIRNLSPKTLSFVSDHPSINSLITLNVPKNCQTVAPGVTCEVVVKIKQSESPLGIWSGYLVVDYDTSKPSEPVAKSPPFPIRGESLLPPLLNIRKLKEADDGLRFPMKCEALKTCSQSFIVTNQSPQSTGPSDAFQMVPAKIKSLLFNHSTPFSQTTTCLDVIDYFTPCLVRIFFHAPIEEGLYSQDLELTYSDASESLESVRQNYVVSASSIKKGVLDFGQEFTPFERVLDIGHVKLDQPLNGTFTVRNKGIGTISNLIFSNGFQLNVASRPGEFPFGDNLPGLRGNFVPGECEMTPTGVLISPNKECRFEISYLLSPSTRSQVPAFAIDQILDLSWSTGLGSLNSTVRVQGGFSNGLGPRWRISNGDLNLDFRICDSESDDPTCLQKISDAEYEGDLGAFHVLDPAKLRFELLANNGQSIELSQVPLLQNLPIGFTSTQGSCPTSLFLNFVCETTVEFISGQGLGESQVKFQVRYRDRAFKETKEVTYRFKVKRDTQTPWFEMRYDDLALNPSTSEKGLEYRANSLRKGYREEKTFQIVNRSSQTLTFTDLFLPTAIDETDAEIFVEPNSTTCGDVVEEGIRNFNLSAEETCQVTLSFQSKSWGAGGLANLLLEPKREGAVSKLAYTGLGFRAYFETLPKLRASVSFSHSIFSIGDAAITPQKFLRLNFGSDYNYPISGPMKNGLRTMELQVTSHLVPPMVSSPFHFAVTSCTLPQNPPFYCDIPFTLDGTWDVVGSQNLDLQISHLTGEAGVSEPEEFEYDLPFEFVVQEPTRVEISQLSFTKEVRLSLNIQHAFPMPETMRSHSFEYQFEDFPKRSFTKSFPSALTHAFETVSYPSTDQIEDKVLTLSFEHPCPDLSAPSRRCRYNEQAYFQVYPGGYSFSPATKKLKVLRTDPHCPKSLSSSSSKVAFSFDSNSTAAEKVILETIDASDCDVLQSDDYAYRLCTAGGGIYKTKGWMFEGGQLVSSPGKVDWVPMRYQGLWEGYECMYGLID